MSETPVVDRLRTRSFGNERRGRDVISGEGTLNCSSVGWFAIGDKSLTGVESAARIVSLGSEARAERSEIPFPQRSTQSSSFKGTTNDRSVGSSVRRLRYRRVVRCATGDKSEPGRTVRYSF